ncbi:MAG: type II toxin-antitoxin system RelE/ParE family toxin [Clostridiales bacterium]|jgi:mRNA interferase RelE/StbE|nr:type II toxin-antitoxin system RelE/ParE family toxin [Clostridiales bacterium]
MKAVLSPQAAKDLERLNEPVKSRIKAALRKLEKEPPQGDIKALEGRDGYRVRIGGYRILFDVTESVVAIYKIEPRGQAYKGR